MHMISDKITRDYMNSTPSTKPRAQDKTAFPHIDAGAINIKGIWPALTADYKYLFFAKLYGNKMLEKNGKQFWLLKFKDPDGNHFFTFCNQATSEDFINNYCYVFAGTVRENSNHDQFNTEIKLTSIVKYADVVISSTSIVKDLLDSGFVLTPVDIDDKEWRKNVSHYI